MKRVPFLYAMLANRLKESEDKDIKMWEFKRHLGRLYHVPKSNALMVLDEMRSFGLLKFDSRTLTISML